MQLYYYYVLEHILKLCSFLSRRMVVLPVCSQMGQAFRRLLRKMKGKYTVNIQRPLLFPCILAVSQVFSISLINSELIRIPMSIWLSIWLLYPLLPLHLWKIKAYLTAALRLWYQSLTSCWSLDINNSVLCGKESWKTNRMYLFLDADFCRFLPIVREV